MTRGVLIVSTVLASWLGMQAVHESGHVIGAMVSGGRVKRVVLDPRTISRTDLAVNPRPLVTVWAGPLLGALLPLGFWGLGMAAKFREAFLLRFFAGFCLIANGAYIGTGSFEAIGDCGEMLRNGSPLWTLWLFGLLAVPAGLAVWHGLGPHFGLGREARSIERRAVWISIGALVGLLAIGLVVDGH